MTFGYGSDWLSEYLRKSKEEEERKRRENSIGAILAGYSSSSPYSSLLSEPPKRKVFVSYHHGDDTAVESFLYQWTEKNKVFTPKALGITDEDNFIDSDDPDYVMSQIREKYLEDSSVTMILIGTCTHSRRYVDWEIKASLVQSEDGPSPNGLIGILLPPLERAHLPPRFGENLAEGHVNCYARFYSTPTSVTQLRGWIEDAVGARTGRAKLINNSRDMMKYNAKCNICGITH